MTNERNKRENASELICFLGMLALGTQMEKQFKIIEPVWKKHMHKMTNEIIDDLSSRGLINKPIN